MSRRDEPPRAGGADRLIRGEGGRLSREAARIGDRLIGGEGGRLSREAARTGGAAFCGHAGFFEVKDMLVKMYTDGAARGNPEGPGGYGVILSCTGKDGELHEREYSGGYRRTSNNRMELTAVITGFEKLLYPCEVEVYSDSKYVIDAFNRHWIDGWVKKGWRGASGPVKNVDLWERLLEVKAPHSVTFIWVKGHDGHPQNERCDRLATAAADGDDLQVDEVWEKEHPVQAERE